jgi:hypothetical protein
MRPNFRVEEIYTNNVYVRIKIKIQLEKNRLRQLLESLLHIGGPVSSSITEALLMIQSTESSMDEITERDWYLSCRGIT